MNKPTPASGATHRNSILPLFLLPAAFNIPFAQTETKSDAPASYASTVANSVDAGEESECTTVFPIIPRWADLKSSISGLSRPSDILSRTGSEAGFTPFLGVRR
jgi:hypothetical protein